MLRFRLPDGVTAVSAQGLSFYADDDGIIVVPDDTPHECINDLTSPHGLGLVPLEDFVLPAEDVTPTTAAAEKRMIRDLLKAYDVRVDGRATLPFLRERLMRAMSEVMLGAKSVDEVRGEMGMEPIAAPADPVDPAQEA